MTFSTSWFRFPWTGLRVGLAVGRRLGLRLHQVRDLIIAVDGLLSLGFHATLLATPAAAVLTLMTGNPIPLLAVLALVHVFLALSRWERRLAWRHWLKDLSIYNVDVGSARTLRGRIRVGHVFLNIPTERYWTRGRVGAAMGRVASASRWIEHQAAGYGVQLELVDEVVSTRGVFRGALGVDAIEKAVSREGSALAQDLERDSSLDGGCLMIHMPFHTTSCALPARIGEESAPSEWCLVSVFAGAGVMAHELLHLFGADDHYHCRNATELEAKLMLIGRSVMFDAHQALARLRVDGVTAQNVGWA